MACNDCLCVKDDYVYKIIRDPADDTLLRAYLYSNENESWHEGQIKTIKIVDGKLAVEYFTDGVEVLDPEGFDIQALQSITDNGDGSFTIIDRDGIDTVIPAGFPSGVIYGDGEFTLITDDGQALTIDLYRSLGCYVKCVSLDCNNDLVFTMVGDSCCAPSGSLTVHIPEADEITNIKDITTTDNVLFQVLKQDGSIMYIDTNAIVTITSGSLTKPAILFRDKYGSTDIVNLNTSNTSAYDNATKTLTITINGVSQVINLQGLASGFSAFLGSYATDAEVQALPAVDGNWAISLETGLPEIWYYVLGSWVDSGTVLAVDLTNYYNKSEIDSLLQPITDTIDLLDTTVTALTLDVQQAVQDINAIKLEQIQQNLEITLLQNKNQNQDDAISDIENILDIVQKFKLTEDNTGFSKSVITSITDLEDATSGFYSAYPDLVETITGVNEAGWFIIHSNSTSGSVVLHTADSNEMWTATKVSDSLGSFVKVNGGGSSVDLSNYQTPTLTTPLGGSKLVLLTEGALLEQETGYYTANQALSESICGVNKQLIIIVYPAGGSNTQFALAHDYETKEIYMSDNYTSSHTPPLAWTKVGDSLTDYQTPKLTKDDGTVLQSVADELELVTLNVGEYTSANTLTELITGNARVASLSILAGPGLFKVAVLYDYIGGEIYTSYYSFNVTTPPLAWTKVGGSTVDLTNYQTPKLTNDNGGVLDTVADEATLFSLAEAGSIGTYQVYGWDILGETISGLAEIYSYNESDSTTQVIVRITNSHTGTIYVTQRSTGVTSFTWYKVGKEVLEMAYIQDMTDNWALAKGTITTTSELWELNHEIGYYTAENFDIDGTQYNGVIELKAESTNASKICEFVTWTGKIFTCRLSGSGYAEPWREIGGYDLVKQDGTNLLEITSDSTLFTAPVGFYDKGSYSIGGSTSSGMIQVFEYGNTSGFKKANAYFSNEIWTATFKTTGFSGDGWTKIAEKVNPYFENTTVTSPITLTSTPQTITTIDNTVVIKARAYLTALVSRTGGTSAVGVVTVTLSDGTNSFTAEYDIGRDLTTTVHLNTAKRLNFPAGTVTLSASYNGTGTVTVNNISASLE